MIDVIEITETILGQFNCLVVTISLAVTVISLALWTMVRPPGFPPGPRGLPIVGSIYSMTDSPEVVFSKWAIKYGDIFGFKVGERWIVVLNHQQVIKEAVIKRAVEFAGRPNFFSWEVFTYGFKDILFSTYSETWKLHRKLAHSALRQFANGKRLQNLIHGVFPKFQRVLAENNDNPVDPKLMITLLLYNVLSTMCFGEDYEFNDPKLVEWKNINEKLNEEFGLGVAADFFSWAKFIPTSGLKMIDKMTETFHAIVWSQLESHKNKFDPDNITDIFDLLLSAQKEAIDDKNPNIEKLTDTHLVLAVSNMFAAGIQTTTETLYWALAFMGEHPGIQCKVRAEIDRVIGRDRFPVIEDRGTLPYTEATLCEVMRCSSIVPIAVPHSTTCDVNFHGYRIPKGTIVMINIHSMHFDPNEWDDPESFKPEHFLDKSGTVLQHTPSFLPFGAGRRSCLGETVAKADLLLIFTWLMQNYSFSKALGKEKTSLLNVITNTAVGRNLKNYQIHIKARN